MLTARFTTSIFHNKYSHRLFITCKFRTRWKYTLEQEENYGIGEITQYQYSVSDHISFSVYGTPAPKDLSFMGYRRHKPISSQYLAPN